MNEYKQKAIDLLDDCPEGPSKASLLALIDYTTNRKK
jgi:geranylgeranyl pyrophosphate synthase